MCNYLVCNLFNNIHVLQLRSTCIDKLHNLIHCIQTTANYHLPPEQVIVSERFGIANVTVTLEWPIPAIEVIYNVSITPQEELPSELNTSNLSSLTQWQLTVYYNIYYSVIIHTSYCGYSNTTSLLNFIRYGECTID